ncbi:MAG TPA: DUF4255 domain-containing protein [Longimicrobium sp.]
MSTPLAIAATTAALRNLLHIGIPRLDPELSDLRVTLQPPDKAREGVSVTQLNLFLYQTTYNAAFRNGDMPSRTKAGEVGQPPLALNLHYVLTAFGRGEADNDALSHRVLGGALSLLHDHPLLGPDELKDALEDGGVHLQPERVRITHQPMPLEEMSKLWTSFQTSYRLSAAIQASVLLIDSARPTRAAPPVVRRGADDGGASAAAGLENPFPHLTAATPPNGQPAVRLGETLVLSGGRLGGTNVGVRFHTRWWDQPVEVLPPSAATDSSVSIEIPDVPADWPAGVYTAAVLVQRPGETYRRETNQLPVVVAPRILTLPAAPVVPVAGTATFDVVVSPRVRPEQRAALLLGDREVPAQPLVAPDDTLTFVIPNAPPGEHWVRIRVDGADTLLVRRDVTPPEFDATQKVTIA